MEISTATRITNLNMAGLTEIKILEMKIALGKAGGDTMILIGVRVVLETVPIHSQPGIQYHLLDEL